mmetsp:Transcript_60849/g.68088  ORF Transcript_60849/g.68088 Transcript_60849/m.68088 type:complete len:391 (-) Transcript_60849:53-1225(-)
MNTSSFHNNSTSTSNVRIPGCRPVLTVPANLYFETDDITIRNNTNNNNNTIASTTPINNENSGYDIYLHENWDSGIGGGLWTTGLALAKYFTTSQHFLQQFYSMQLQKKKQLVARRSTTSSSRRQYSCEEGNDVDDNNLQQQQQQQQSPLRILELGSGNGFLSVCLITAIAVATANTVTTSNTDDDDDNESNNDIDIDSNSNTTTVGSREGIVEIDVIVTDTKEHLQLMKETIESNLQRILPQIVNRSLPRKLDYEEKEDSEVDTTTIDNIIEKIVSVKEYLWGEEHYDFGTGEKDDENNDGSQYFDLIIGSDVVYRDHLHDPFIQALTEFSSPSTIAIIGVTMSDTKPIFFTKLIQAGFHYEKLAEHLFDIEFNTCDRQFGIFVISRSI